MKKTYKQQVFLIIYSNVLNKHPDWSLRRILAVTRYCYKKSMK